MHVCFRELGQKLSLAWHKARTIQNDLRWNEFPQVAGISYSISNYSHPERWNAVIQVSWTTSIYQLSTVLTFLLTTVGTGTQTSLVVTRHIVVAATAWLWILSAEPVGISADGGWGWQLASRYGNETTNSRDPPNIKWNYLWRIVECASARPCSLASLSYLLASVNARWWWSMGICQVGSSLHQDFSQLKVFQLTVLLNFSVELLQKRQHAGHTWDSHSWLYQFHTLVQHHLRSIQLVDW